MNSQASVKLQLLELKRMLERAMGDPILEPQLRNRIHDAEDELASTASEPIRPAAPRTAIFLKGGGVIGSQGIRPSLAGESLIQYEKMFIEQALHDEREAARASGLSRRPKGSLTPGLLFVGTPRGSFGLEFTPAPSSDKSLDEIHVRSLENIANAITSVTNETVVKWEEPIPPSVLRPLRLFLKTLAQNGAELRMSFDNRAPQSFPAAEINRAFERLEREVKQEEREIQGEFRGLTLETGMFDIRPDGGHVVSGRVADGLDDDQLEDIYNLLNERCVFKVIETTVIKAGIASPPTYTLLSAEPIAE
jgi:hypothetical protein